MDKKESLAEINSTQDFYVDLLAHKIKTEKLFKSINFTSDTGTGKTMMMCKLMNILPDYFFIVTTLSKGQLDKQIELYIQKNTKYNNYVVFGVSKLKCNTVLTAKDILNCIPSNKETIWLRDEGHISTNVWMRVLEENAHKIINFSATNTSNSNDDIKCNFTHTLMLRTVNQKAGTPEDAINKLLEVKKAHKKVNNYNPCAIFRCLDNNLLSEIIISCENHNLNYINITDDLYDMSEICQDNNKYDVIINKFKIVEGIDIRRAHVVYVGTPPTNDSTAIQIIGRCRRNALLYRDDIDILNNENEELLSETRNCYVFYNYEKCLDVDENGELVQQFCNEKSVQEIKIGKEITVVNGEMKNGIRLIELNGCTGTYLIERDGVTGFNFAKKITGDKIDFYKKRIKLYESKSNVYIAKNNDNSPIPIESKIEKGFYNIYRVSPSELLYSIPVNDILCTFKKEGIKYARWNKRDLHDLYIAIEHYYVGGSKYKNSLIEKYKISDDIVNIDDDYLIDLSVPYSYFPFTKIVNDWESSIIGTDAMMQIKYVEEYQKLPSFLGLKRYESYYRNQWKREHPVYLKWIENKKISYKVKHFSKLNSYIENKYDILLLKSRPFLFSSKKSFDFDNKCCSCLGYLVEYYSKFLVYGELYIKKYIYEALKEKKDNNVTIDIVLRACMLKYIEEMCSAFSHNIKNIIPSISINELIKEKYEEFKKCIVELGNKTATFIKSIMNVHELNYGDQLHCPNLSIDHISGLADYIDEFTIVDIKVTNSIDISHIKQVLGYYYLSTKRSDLHIKKVVVYDAVSDKAIIIDLTTNDVYLKEKE